MTVAGTMVSPRHPDAVFLDRAAKALYGEGSEAIINSCSPIREQSEVVDAQEIYVIDDAFILFVSTVAFPDASFEQVEAMESMKNRLNLPSVAAIPPILAHGYVDGRSYMVMPRLRPLRSGKLSGRIDELLVRRSVLEWLRAVASSFASADARTLEEFSASLQALQQLEDLPDKIRRDAALARDRLCENPALAVSVPMHGDMWSGNIMRDRKGQLAIIDWSTSVPQGFGFFDLVTLAYSLRISGQTLARELDHHRVILGDLPKVVVKIHVLAALGFRLRHIDQFPLAKFVDLACECYQKIENY